MKDGHFRNAGARRTVSVILTVKNDREGARVVLDSLLRQTRLADEIVVVDGGSTDGTVEFLRELAGRQPCLRILRTPGCNIAQGRNIATQAAVGEIIVATDAGCRADETWLQRLVQPFETDPTTDFVAGFYQVEARMLFEKVVGLATMRGALDPVDDKTFNPSGRSMAYTKMLWSRAGGWPEWIRFSEDTLFDHRLRRLGVVWRFVPDAIVHWRPRSTLRGLAKQFYGYGTGRGHTQIGAKDFAYNLRNLCIVLLTTCVSIMEPAGIVLLGAMLGYFYVWTFHAKARRIARRTGTWKGYPLCILVMWIVLIFNTAGYVVGSVQRWKTPRCYRDRMRAYLSPA